MIFRISSEKTAQKNADSTRASRDRLIQRLAQAQDTVKKANEALHLAARDGADDAALGTGEAKVREAEGRVSTLTRALAETAELLETLENERSDIAETKQRGETAAAIEHAAQDLEKSAEMLNAAMAALVESTTQAAIITRDADGLKNFAANVLIEVPPVIAMTAAMMRDCASDVISGVAPAAMPTAEAPLAHVVTVAPPTVRVFTTRAISWTDAAGQLRLSGRYRDADLPPETAARALVSGICLKTDNPARRQYLNSWPGHPDPSNVTCLDEIAPGTAAPLRDSKTSTGIIEVVGTPYSARITSETI